VPRERSKTYISVTFHVPHNLADEAAGILIRDGALGCEVRKLRGQAHAATRRRNAVLLHAYFERITPAMIKRLHAELKAAGMIVLDSIPEQQVVEDPGWATMWQERFVPLRVGRRLLIVPPWQLRHEPSRITIVIRPGQAFGTGHHASTTGTLEALERLCVNRRVTHALDVGTGSGILAISMVKLGVADVTAIDVDSKALENARENATLNQVTSRIRFSSKPLDAVPGKFGLIAANILSSTLIQMAPELSARLRAHGYLVLAGILQHEAQSVADAYVLRLGCVGWRDLGAWTTLIFQE
jgi:ribosomal protein L11 methyltransferase